MSCLVACNFVKALRLLYTSSKVCLQPPFIKCWNSHICSKSFKFVSELTTRHWFFFFLNLCDYAWWCPIIFARPKTVCLIHLTYTGHFHITAFFVFGDHCSAINNTAKCHHTHAPSQTPPTPSKQIACTEIKVWRIASATHIYCLLYPLKKKNFHITL